MFCRQKIAINMPVFKLNERVIGRAPGIKGELGIVRHTVGGRRTKKYPDAFDSAQNRDCASHLWHSGAYLAGKMFHRRMRSPEPIPND